MKFINPDSSIKYLSYQTKEMVKQYIWIKTETKEEFNALQKRFSYQKRTYFEAVNDQKMCEKEYDEKVGVWLEKWGKMNYKMRLAHENENCKIFVAKQEAQTKWNESKMTEKVKFDDYVKVWKEINEFLGVRQASDVVIPLEF
jgi:hypothetical protein